MVAEGYVWYCLGCKLCYKEKPREWYADGRSGDRGIDMCSCGCDLFGKLEDFINGDE